MAKWSRIGVGLPLLFSLAWIGCGESTKPASSGAVPPTATSSPVAAPSASPTALPTLMPSATLVPSATLPPTATMTATALPPAPTSTPTQSPGATVSATMGPTPMAIAHAKRVTSADDLIGGPMALGHVGDYLLANDKIRAVIRRPRPRD